MTSQMPFSPAAAPHSAGRLLRVVYLLQLAAVLTMAVGMTLVWWQDTGTLTFWIATPPGFDPAPMADGIRAAAQNLGGIGNVTYLPAGGDLSSVRAFDTGPGNMVIDGLMSLLTAGAATFDRDGEMAASGVVDRAMLDELLADDYLRRDRRFGRKAQVNKPSERQKQSCHKDYDEKEKQPAWSDGRERHGQYQRDPDRSDDDEH